MGQRFLVGKKRKKKKVKPSALAPTLHKILKKISLIEKKSGELESGKGHPIYVCYIIEIDF